MPSVKVAPSLLASDLGNLSYECNRMIRCGADWLHMGMYMVPRTECMLITNGRCNGWPFRSKYCDGTASH